MIMVLISPAASIERVKVVMQSYLVKPSLLLVALLLAHLDGGFGCSGRQVITNSTEGILTDGPNDYPPNAHCEWLIVAPHPKQYIMLDFTKMDTECTYDFLFVFDGQSYSSHLLGSFSGNTVPDTLSAKSGYMLIYFYSDRNYVLGGFDAMYKITNCPLDCNGKGSCKDHTCHCNSGYFGESCELEMNPNNCGDGTWDTIKKKCICVRGYAGMDCKIALNVSDNVNSWNIVAHSESGFSARVGHAGAFLKPSESLWIFGGHNLNNFLNDLLQFNFVQNQWITIPQSVPWPRACYGHTVTAVGADLFMLGGMLEDNTHTNELWHYNVSAGSWSLKANTSNIKPPGLVYHTTTLVEGRWLYVFGGRHENGSFSSNMYRIVVPEAIKWEVVAVKGGKDTVRRLIGHSTVYHPESKSLLVFGGLKPEYARFSERSNLLHAFNVDKNYWSQIYYNTDSDVGSPPKSRAFHSANIMGNYMVVYGGNSHKHSHDEICYDNGLYLYHLGCHIWVSLRDLQKNFSVNVVAPPSGRFSHVAAVAYDNTLLIAGGYRGNVLGDLRAYVVPPPLAKHESEAMIARQTDHCSQYSHDDYCIADPECGWCYKKKVSLLPGCLHRSNGRLCMEKLRTKKCPGICGTLISCQACTVMGKKALPTDTTLTRLQQNENCAWCVKEARCQKLDVPSGTCSPAHGTISGIAGWWGKNSTRIIKLSSCRTDDYPAGLHWIKYKNPQNYSYPDEVTLVRTSKVEYQFRHVIKKELSIGGKNLAMFKGFIHPLDAPSSTGGDLIVSLVVIASEGKLYMSRNGSPKEKEEVAKLASDSYGTTNARRPQGGPIFPNKTRGHKYYTELESWREVPRYENQQIMSTMSLKWTGALADKSHADQPISAEFLEPYNSGSCKNYTNCMACMTDTSCGWCPSSAACLNKMSTDLPASSCGSSNPDTYLITLSDDCPVCNDLVSCDVCTQNPLCEWLVEDARCMRRGRFPGDAVLAPDKCPLSCVLRSNCSSCMSTPECAWCEKTKTCFAFSQYITRHVYGQCAEWVDSMSAKKCTECSQHKTCKSCNDDFQCGWCGNTYNPTIGRCMDGDFVGPFDNGNCSALISQVHNVSAAADWSYGICPDVEECLLGLDNCHQNATCHNTFDSYTCECNRGFMGNGRDVCNKTCYYNCRHGHCSGPPDYVCQCNIGWTGNECNSNCGCNNHSTCLDGIGKCDKCLHWTVGTNCENCKPGSYGNATNSLGCTKCNCNDHGIDSLGVCNITSGVCFCQDNTEGNNCERCKSGFYGDPRNGGKCYLKCEGRNLIVNATSSALGTYAGKGMENKSHVFCLWIITVYPDLNSTESVLNTPIITFTMEKTISLECSKDYVYVYDGIPALASGRPEDKPNLLGAFCGRGLAHPISVEAKTGYLTVYFEADLTEPPDSTSGGFNAIYTVHGCPSSCFHNRVCQGGHCVCRTGFRGVACDQELCPLNCSSDKGQGSCDLVKGLCVCQSGFGGAACNESVTNVGVFSLLMDPERLSPTSSLALPPARMGHSFVSCDGERFFLYGGYSVTDGILGDMWEYNKAGKLWTEVTLLSTDNPKPRYFHATACVNTVQYMYMFGGHMNNMTDFLNSKLNYMWKYSPEHKKWTSIKTPANIQPLAGHTMTLIDDTNLIIIGGFTTTNYFSEKIYKYDTSKSTGEWKEITTNGAVPTGVYGHTSVYNKKSNTIYVYGGYFYHVEKTIVSNFLYALDFNDMTWSRLQPSAGTEPRPRFFHAAVTNDDYMLVLGGRSGTESFSSDVMAYHYKCNKWTDLKKGGNGTEFRIYGDGPPALIGQAVKATPTEIYIFGGYSGISHGSLIELQMPSDLCQMIADVDVCLATFGCMACIKIDGAGNNLTFCYSSSKQSQESPCANDPKAQFFPVNQDNVCSVQRLENRDCNIHKNCTDCLATWPVFRNARRVCKWCSLCPTGKCIPSDANCSQMNPCQQKQTQMTNSGRCWARQCQAADCDKCVAQGCMWSRQFKRSGEVSRSVHAIPTFDWNCVTENLRKISQQKIQTIESMPPDRCPRRCYLYSNWSTCLSSHGSEGGFQKCVWSKTLGECMPPAYLPMHCTNGRCGHMVFHTESYPSRCSGYKQCSQCLDSAGCGWCAFGSRNGVGLCMEGGLYRPIYGSCKTGDVQLGNEPLSELLSHLLVEARNVEVMWAFAKCPAENECQNDHHTCDDNEDCVDIPVGFNCTCKEGYMRDDISKKCLPVCDPGCGQHGTCVKPNECLCHFGYVGKDCSTECDCNGHSACLSEQKDVCLECMNNTQGTRCSVCKPLFVGDPRNGGKCIPCFEYCNEHTSICMEEAEYKAYTLMNGQSGTNLANITKFLKRGPLEKAVCYDCGNNTRGDKCEGCQLGYFRLNADANFSPTFACRKCECNGHGEICDQKDGKHCDCKNNTETHCKDDSGPCWQSQCSDCKEYFLGRPTNGHQCYRQMTVEIDYCFNPKTQTECQNPSPLPYGHSVFYAVQPKYLNVDIRITIDVSKGGVDVYFSPYDDTFIVNTDPLTYTHLVTVDPKYYTAVAEYDSNRRNLRSKRSAGSNSTKAIHVMDIQNAKELNTFITIMEKDTFLIVRDVRFRLVITLPLEIHNLKESRFYIVLISKMDSENNGTFGNMYFRQDQPHIDLFVFFSVFFSCFFLFLAVCVLLWKIKQGIDERRNRQRRAIEMEHMASRPFGKVTVLIDRDLPYQQISPPARKNRLPKINGRFSQDSRDNHSALDPYNVAPIAHEPTDDGIAAVGTVMFQLPGGSSAPVRAALGSALITMRVMYPNMNQPKAQIRRRTCSVNT